MISKIGRKVFFINPPEVLKNEFLGYLFRKEFELYLLDDNSKMIELLDHFQDAIVFINIDKGMSSIEWVNYIKNLQKRFKNVCIGVFTKKISSSLQKILLIDIGISGGYINIEHDNWKTIEIINQVLEVNEARGRRKSVRLDFKTNESRGSLKVNVFTQKGYNFSGVIESMSSAGLLVRLPKGRIKESDNVDKVIFSLLDNILHINGYLLKRFDNGNYFISFEDIDSADKEFVQSYIFDYLQKGFKQLLKSL